MFLLNAWFVGVGAITRLCGDGDWRAQGFFPLFSRCVERVYVCVCVENGSSCSPLWSPWPSWMVNTQLPSPLRLFRRFAIRRRVSECVGVWVCRPPPLLHTRKHPQSLCVWFHSQRFEKTQCLSSLSSFYSGFSCFFWTEKLIFSFFLNCCTEEIFRAL